MIYLVTSGFPDKLTTPETCRWSVEGHGDAYITATVKELNMLCVGGNKLFINDGIQLSRPICGKRPPAITSSGNSLEFELVINNPGPKVI